MPENSNNSYDPSTDPDIKLMIAFQNGDKAAFEKLLTAYFSRVMNFIYKYVNNRELAEDLTQEVFIKVYRSAHQYTPKAKLRTWLFTIAKNTALNELRKNTLASVSLDTPFTGEEGDMRRQVEDRSEIRVDVKLVQEEKAVRIRETIAQLPENQKTAVILRRYEEMSYEEIAATMQTTVKSVKSLLSRAKENLKNSLSDLLG